MNFTWAQFKRDKYFLTKYFSLHWVALIAFTTALVSLRGIPQSLDFSWVHLAVVPLSIFFGIMIPVLMHNCTHGNLRNETLNVIVGEVTAFFCLMSLGIVRINHTLHHAYSDTKDDPHPPGQKSFLKFFLESQLSGADVIEEKFLDYHGRTLWNKSLFKFNRILHYGSYALRLSAWLFLLGPELFLCLYLPSFLVFSLGFAHVNYVTHSTSDDGAVEILNKNDNHYYKFVNYIGSGIYFHKNHHKNPRAMNPMPRRRRVSLVRETVV